MTLNLKFHAWKCQNLLQFSSPYLQWLFPKLSIFRDIFHLLYAPVWATRQPLYTFTNQLLLQSSGILPSFTTPLHTSVIHFIPTSPAAFIISATTLDGPAGLLDSIPPIVAPTSDSVICSPGPNIGLVCYSSWGVKVLASMCVWTNPGSNPTPIIKSLYGLIDYHRVYPASILQSRVVHCVPGRAEHRGSCEFFGCTFNNAADPQTLWK